jgi:hypothetical protein
MSETDKTTEIREKFLARLALGFSVQGACDAAVMGRATAYRWRSENPDFAEAWDAAIEAGTDCLEDIAMQRAKERSDVLMIVMLKARRPDKYAEVSKQRITGKDDDSPVKLGADSRILNLLGNALDTGK